MSRATVLSAKPGSPGSEQTEAADRTVWKWESGQFPFLLCTVQKYTGPMAAAAQQNVQQILQALLSSRVVNRGQAEAGTIIISACGFQGRVSI
jgi:hypothetical protein